jgi:hypothetical protein
MKKIYFELSGYAAYIGIAWAAWPLPIYRFAFIMAAVSFIAWCVRLYWTCPEK